MTWREDAAVDTASQRIPRRFLLQARELAQTGALGRDVNPYGRLPASHTESAKRRSPNSKPPRSLTELMGAVFPPKYLHQEVPHQAWVEHLMAGFLAQQSDQGSRLPLEP